MSQLSIAIRKITCRRSDQLYGPIATKSETVQSAPKRMKKRICWVQDAKEQKLTVNSASVHDDSFSPAQPTALAGKRAVGRPRRLTLDAIVDAACLVGIERLEMCTVAQQLNTGVATLYGYVRGRDHLLELVAERMASRAISDNYGGTWQEVLHGHARERSHKA